MGRTETDFYHAALAAGLPIRPAAGQPWLSNRGHFNPSLDPDAATWLSDLFARLGGHPDLLAGKTGGGHPRPDFVIENWRVLIEVDEIQHLTSDRIRCLESYPAGLDVAFDVKEYLRVAKQWRHKGDHYRAAKPSCDFPFAGGRRAQRAYFDSVRDVAASRHGWRLVRVAAPECDGRLAFRRWVAEAPE